MKLLLIRHGDPDYQTDSLTEVGLREAEALASYSQRLGITHLYASPLGRAQATAMPTSKALGLPIVTLPWAKELTGIYYDVEGFGICAPFTLPGEVILTQAPEPCYSGWETQPYYDHPGFKALIEALQEGSDALLARHGYRREGALYHCETPNEDVVALFCHLGLGSTWLSHMLRIAPQAIWAGVWLAPTSVTTLVMEHRSPHLAVPRMLAMGETTHLALAGLPISPSGLHQNLVDGSPA